MISLGSPACRDPLRSYPRFTALPSFLTDLAFAERALLEPLVDDPRTIFKIRLHQVGRPAKPTLDSIN